VRVSDFLAAELAVVPLRGSTRAAIADELAERLIAAGRVTAAERLRERVTEGREADAVLLGTRALLIHYRTEAVRDLSLAIGVAPDGIDIPERAASPRIVLMVAIPPRSAGRYVQLLGAFARILDRADVVERIVASRTAEELVSLPAFGEYEVPDQLTVRELMTERPRVTGPDVPLVEAARQLVRSGIGALPVVDAENRVVGMLGERELLRELVRLLGGREVPSAAVGRASSTVRDVMTRQVLCVSPEQPIAEVAALMINKDVDRVPVARSGELVGFLTRGDIVRKLTGT
jgi:CBS domain-containing protein